MVIHKLLYFISLVCFFSCGGLQNRTATSTIPSRQNEDHLLFLTFKITKGSALQKSKITLIEQSKSTGKMKSEIENTLTSPNYLTVVCYENTSIAKTVLLPHPLFKHIEYLNEANQYASKDIELKDETFFIRLPFNPKIRKISIFETLRNTPKEELFTLNL